MAVNHEYDSFSAYGSCLSYVRYTISRCPYAPDMPAYIFVAMGCIGVINNFMSQLVFSHPKYGKGAISRLLRYFYRSNVIASGIFSLNEFLYYILPPFSDPNVELVKRIVTLIAPVAFKTSYGMLAYMAVLRCLSYKYPEFITFSREVQTLSYLVIMFLVAGAIGVDIKRVFLKFDLISADEILVIASFYTAAMVTVVVFNALWLALTLMQTRTRSLSVHAGEFERRFSESTQVSKSYFYFYACVSSVMFVVATMPAAVHLWLPPARADWKPTCQDCADRIEVADWLWMFMYAGCCFDNLVYIVGSRQYRRELGSALCCWR